LLANRWVALWRSVYQQGTGAGQAPASWLAWCGTWTSRR